MSAKEMAEDRRDDKCVCDHWAWMHDVKAPTIPEGSCVVCALSPSRTPCEKFKEAK